MYSLRKESMCKTTQAYLYQEIPLSFVQPRIEAFLRTTTGSIFDSESKHQPSATWVKKIVIEDIIHISPRCLGLANLDPVRRPYERHAVEQRRLLRPFDKSCAEVYESAKLLENLDTIEYIFGFRVPASSASTEEKIKILQNARATSRAYPSQDWNKQYTMELWKYRQQFWTTPKFSGRDRTDSLVKAALESKSRKGPLRVIMRTVHPSSLCQWTEQFSEDNKLHSLELVYLDCNMSIAQDMYGDRAYFATPAPHIDFRISET